MEDQEANPGPVGPEPTTPTKQLPVPGLLKLRELAINKGQITLVEEKQLQRTISDMFYILNKKVHSLQFLNAVRNVTGLMYYRSFKIGKAMQLWLQTVECDPQNLNALQDLATAYRKLHNNKEAIEYERKIKELQENASDEDRRLMMARCQLEQAYAQFRDLPTESGMGVEGRKKQVESYEEGLHLAGKLYDEERHQREGRSWLLYTAKAHERLADEFLRIGQHTKQLKAIEKAIEILDDVLQKCEQNDVFRAEVYYFMGNTFDRNEGSIQYEVTLPKILAEKYKREWNDPSLSYENALKLDPDNIWILSQRGIFWSKKKSNDKALKYLNDAIAAADKPGEDNHIKRSCWNALYHKAKINMKEAQCTPPPKDSYKLLQSARQDSSRAVEYNFSPAFLTLNGEVLHLLAKHPDTSEKDAKALRNTALQRFYEASACNISQSMSYTHLKWADFLMDDEQDLPSATETYKVAFETARDKKGGYKVHIASQLLCAMLQNFANEKNPGYLLKELAFWFTYIYHHCQPACFYFKMLLWDNASEVLDVMECLVCQTPLPRDEMCLYEEMIQPALKDFSNMLNNRKFKYSLQKQNCTKFESRLKNLIQENKQNINNCPVVPKSPMAASPRDHHPPPEHPLAEGVEYDFYIIYDTGDYTVEGWVEFSLLSGLECPFYGLKGCFDKRDFRRGTGRLQEWTSALTQSAYILIVLTPNMSLECMHLIKMSQGFERKDIIVIQRQVAKVPSLLHRYRKFDFSVWPNIPKLAQHIMP
ncbi:uncharacterized protein [Diadema antillarum]|uniref:uncharacterized protein n=1 Tax=Diadema antillarum TaxID=105358 RepID=UPI003A8984A8